MRCLISTSSFGKIDSTGLNLLRQAGFQITLNPFGRKLRKKETLELYPQADVVIAGVEDIDHEVFAACPDLLVISRCGIGVDGIDLAEARRRGVPVLVTPEPPAQAVSELAIGLIFSLARHISRSDASIRQGEWKPLLGTQISGKTLGIVGFGRVGQKVAQTMKAAGMNVWAYDPAPNAQAAAESGVTLGTLDEVLALADFVTLHVPLISETRKLFDDRRLRKMKKGSFLINTARGGIIDEDALYEVLQAGHLAGAALDVFEQEPYEGRLRELPNVVMTAHMGSYAAEARMAMETEAAKNLIAECGRRGLIRLSAADIAQ